MMINALFRILSLPFPGFMNYLLFVIKILKQMKLQERCCCAISKTFFFCDGDSEILLTQQVVGLSALLSRALDQEKMDRTSEYVPSSGMQDHL